MTKVNVYEKDITTFKTYAIINAANGQGIMGAGVAGAIGRVGGWNLRNSAILLCKERGGFEAGEFYKTDSGNLVANGVRKVYHVVTMQYPGQRSVLEDVERAFDAALSDAEQEYNSIATPGLGIGIGGLNKEEVAKMMVRVASNHDIQVNIVDMDKKFIEYVKKAIVNNEKE